MKIKTAMILAAGYGKRMKPLTDKLPKPLIQVAGRSLLDRILDQMIAAGVERSIINHHYLGDQILDHLNRRKDIEILFSEEREEPLETGGGVVKALDLIGAEPFFVVNGDVLWLNGPISVFERLAGLWDSATMDALLTLHPTVSAIGLEREVGDFHMEADGRLTRRGENQVAPFQFAGIHLTHPEFFSGCKAEPFSLNRLWDRALEAERLYGMRHDGTWYHVGTPKALEEAEAALADDLSMLGHSEERT